MHFLCVCDKYDVERNEMYLSISEKYPESVDLNTVDKLVFFMKTEWKEVCNFVDKAWRKRKELLYYSDT